MFFFFFKQKTAYEMRISDWSSDVCSSDLCPVWPGQPITAHWGFEDPSAFEGTDLEKRAFFDKIFRQIANRIRIFNSLPLTTLDRVAIKRELDALGNQSTQTATS